MGKKSSARRVLGALLLFVFAAAVVMGATTFPRPGQQTATPVQRENLDAASYRTWQSGQEYAPEGRGGDQGPEWVLWTNSPQHTGHSGLTFGIRKQPGPRHVRIGFKKAVPVGSVLTRGSIQVSVLRPTAAYPGNLGEDADWLQGKRLADGAVTTDQAERDECALWVFPAGTTTRALRFTHRAMAADPTYEGWLGGAVVLKARLLNLAPFAAANSQSNNRHAPKVVNELTDSWGCWENVSMDESELANQPPVSPAHPEWIQLTWRGPVQLNGLITVWTGFGAMDVLAYTGPAECHPRDASDTDWTKIASPSGFESGYPTALWPNWFPFEKPVKTRAIRLRITAVTPAGHPHVKRRPAGGKRVWLGEVMAVQDIGIDACQAPDIGAPVVAGPHAPIPVPFSLPEAGYVTLVLENQHGIRVRNLISETWFPAGQNTAWWDGTDDLGRDVDAANHGLYNIPARFVSPGTYRARGLWRKEIKAYFEFAVYGAGDPPWSTPDHTGAWLANHSPPEAALFVPASYSPTGEPAVFLGCYVTEGPDGFAWVDLVGRKRGGMKWIGGNWTAAPFLGRDAAPDADPKTSAYVASVWETDKKSGVYEVRVNALDRQDGNQLKARTVYRAVVGKQQVDGDDQRAVAREQVKLGGVAAYGGVVVCSFPNQDRVLRIDAAAGTAKGDLTIDAPRGLAYDNTGRLFVISGTQVLRIAPSTTAGEGDVTPTTVVSRGLEDPCGLTLDPAGNLYISDRGSSHQVKVYSEHPPEPAQRDLLHRLLARLSHAEEPLPPGEYTLIRTIGRHGKPQAGPYDALHMNNPAGIAVDSQQQLWVAENDFMPKRVSVWSRDGELIKAFYGPGKYGGGGALDAHDERRFYYADETKGTLEFRLDWERGTAELASVLCRRTPESMEMPFRCAAPETALYRGRQRYFTNCYNTNPTGGHNTAFLYIDRDSVARPAAAMGLANEWSMLKTEPYRGLWPKEADPDGDKWRDGRVNQALFVWSDTNGDARVQPEEVTLHHTPVRGVTVMENLSFCIANAGGRALRLTPVGFSAKGIPSYDYSRAEVLAEGVHDPKSSGGCQMLADDSGEAVITLGVEPFDPYSISGVADGRAVWSYPSPWPGLHASHHAAKPDRPGQLIGTTRLLGGFVHPKGSEVGPVWAVNGNMGNLYLLTRGGLFVATVFKDVRQGRLWKMAVAQRGMALDGISLHDENFWPSISQRQDGHVYLVDGAHCSLVRLDGLESLRRIAPVDVPVTAADLTASQRYVLDREVARQKAFGSGILHAGIRATAPEVDGDLSDWADANWVEIDRRGAGANFNSTAKPYNILGAVAAAGDRLYAAWDTRDAKLLTNSGETPKALFKTGGALDLMLGCDATADANRRRPVAGDLRLLVTQVGRDTRATLYRQVDPDAGAADKVPFSSPWRTVVFDRVRDVSDQVTLAADGKGGYEISVPLALLGLRPKPGLTLKGDIGILRGTGTETTARAYWSNKATGITADVPSEVMLTPHLWGTVEWE